MRNSYPKRNIMCIDLKSFFAACECVERGLDPFTTPLVVADPARGSGAITLAVTPALKKMGVKGRTRIFEIPRRLKYLRVKPRMSLYMKKSSEVVDVYLEFVAKEDLHIYSIDECFLDVTNYLTMYKMTDYELAQRILTTLFEKTGLTANCGIGPNILLAKIAMDIDAKKYKNGIVKWEYEDIEKKLWPISPLSKVWGIGPRMEKKLNNIGIKTIGDLANYNKIDLIKKFGVMGEEMWNHANGIDNSSISDWQAKRKDESISHSQVLFKDYYGDNIKLIVSEMVEVLTVRLRKRKKLTNLVGFGIGYSKDSPGGFYHSMKLDAPTDDIKKITDFCFAIFDRYYEKNMPIRKITIAFGRLTDKDSIQLNLFESLEEKKQKENIYSTLDDVRKKFGKNSIVNASSLLPDSTILDRNKKTGGHNSN